MLSKSSVRFEWKHKIYSSTKLFRWIHNLQVTERVMMLRSFIHTHLLCYWQSSNEKEFIWSQLSLPLTLISVVSRWSVTGDRTEISVMNGHGHFQSVSHLTDFSYFQNFFKCQGRGEDWRGGVKFLLNFFGFHWNLSWIFFF